ncbi:MAG: nicotinate-nucleotide--dimethylbenzimidazole phosphoribosyltransferase [Deltaproteobacteria bacterium]|nr:nicotinate-nucleotide--dimethylbenzimidazole phosphoribosyltransferase [Deltaproteobacteria bacterium]
MNELDFDIQSVSSGLRQELLSKIDSKTKPLKALGKLEDLALKIGMIQNTLEPVLSKPSIVVFAGDHGIVSEGVSAYPQEVTYQMVLNFVKGGAAISIFSRENDIELYVVDAGVNYDFPPSPKLIQAKIAKGTQNYLYTPAMSQDECETAIFRGSDIVQTLHEGGCNIIGLGEMGIGNTSSAAILTSLLCEVPIEVCVGKGTGLSDKDVDRKADILRRAIDSHKAIKSPLEVLSTFGGFEIAMMCGAFLKAAELRMVVLVDGFIATAALLVSSKIDIRVLDYCISSHVSHERGHRQLLNYLKAEPLLDLSMCLGEGSGVAVAYPVVKASVNFLNQMASFESAEVSKKIV